MTTNKPEVAMTDHELLILAAKAAGQIPTVFIVLLGLIYCASARASLAPDAKVPILLYHTRTISEPCEYGSDDLVALERDLETLHAEGFTVMPVYWLVQWSLGWRDGSTLSDKVVGITIDDGYDADFIDRTPAPIDCPPRKSARSILEAFHKKYEDELPPLSPHASLFVIASREVRNLLDPVDQHFGDNWWAAAHHHPMLEVYNHSSDHDHPVVDEKIYDYLLGAWLPASGHADGEWKGRLRPDRSNNLASSVIHFSDAGAYIASRIGAWPDLFAHPMGRVSEYARLHYLPKMTRQHGLVAAFCTEIQARGPRPENYLQRGQDRWCLPRLTHGYSWRTPEEFLAILRGAQK